MRLRPDSIVRVMTHLDSLRLDYTECGVPGWIGTALRFGRFILQICDDLRDLEKTIDSMTERCKHLEDRIDDLNKRTQAVEMRTRG